MLKRTGFLPLWEKLFQLFEIFLTEHVMHLLSCLTGEIVKAKGERNRSPLSKTFTTF